jgi:hypothetical protein
MKGYSLPKKTFEPRMEQTLVGCRHCCNTWMEELLNTTGVSINGALYTYDACDKCYDADALQFRDKSGPCLADFEDFWKSGS